VWGGMDYWSWRVIFDRGRGNAALIVLYWPIMSGGGNGTEFGLGFGFGFG